MDHFDKPKNMKTLKVLYQHIVLTKFIAFFYFFLHKWLMFVALFAFSTL